MEKLRCFDGQANNIVDVLLLQAQTFAPIAEEEVEIIEDSSSGKPFEALYKWGREVCSSWLSRVVVGPTKDTESAVYFNRLDLDSILSSMKPSTGNLAKSMQSSVWLGQTWAPMTPLRCKMKSLLCKWFLVVPRLLLYTMSLRNLITHSSCWVVCAEGT